MAHRGKSRQIELPACRVCGMFAGRRMMTQDGMQYAVVCDICGFKTKLHTTQSAATSEWKYGNRIKKKP